RGAMATDDVDFLVAIPPQGREAVEPGAGGKVLRAASRLLAALAVRPLGDDVRDDAPDRPRLPTSGSLVARLTTPQPCERLCEQLNQARALHLRGPHETRILGVSLWLTPSNV